MSFHQQPSSTYSRNSTNTYIHTYIYCNNNKHTSTVAPRISQPKTTRSIHKHPQIRTQSASHKLYIHWKLHIQARRTHSSFKAKHPYTKPNWLSLLTVVHRSITPVHSLRNLTKHKIYTYTQRSSFQLQFINKVKGTSLLQPPQVLPRVALPSQNQEIDTLHRSPIDLHKACLM